MTVSAVEARNQVSREEGVTLGEVKIIAVEQRQVGPTAKYIIDGQPGIHRLVLDAEGGNR